MQYKILGISGSPRKNSNTEVMIKHALEGAAEIEGVQTEIITLDGKRVGPCYGCYQCVQKKSVCIFNSKDYMEEIYEKWLAADGILIGSPVYHLTVPGVLKNVLDRLGESIWSMKATGQLTSGWFGKVGGVLTQGMAAYGGQEYTASYLVNHLLLMNCMVVPAERMTVPGVIGSFGGVKEYEPGVIAQYDAGAMENARIMGRRVAEMAKIMKNGVAAVQNELPREYTDFLLTKEGFQK